ncbi:retrovirus-related pol polyprotein from transposon TNT 1-94 [Tanacetum coccineum]
MKAVKEKEQWQKKLDSWKDSSKNLWRLINSGMSSNSKVGLGYEIQSNNEVLSYEEEMNFSVFNCSKEDSVGKPLSVQLNTGRTNINSVRPNINTGRTNVNPVRPRVNTGSSNVNTVRSRQPVPNKTSNNFSPKRPQGNWGSAIKTSAGYNWRSSNSNCDSVPTFIRIDHPLEGTMVDRDIFDSGCSGHMTGNKDQLEDFEEFNGGSVTFGGSKGYISGKGKIRVGNLDFDSVSFVKELGHFNLFSISQICDKQHKVLFTETECLVVSSDFKMPDENQASSKDKPNVKGVGYRWMFDIDYLTDSMNYILVSLENQANPHAGASEVTNSAGTSQTPCSNASEEKYEDVELIVVLKLSRNLSQLRTGVFVEASYDEEGVITDFNSLPTEIEDVADMNSSPRLSEHPNSKDAGSESLSHSHTAETLSLRGSLLTMIHDIDEISVVVRNGDEMYYLDGESKIEKSQRVVPSKLCMDCIMLLKLVLLLIQTIPEERSRIQRGTIDKTLFIKRDKKDIMLVQVYVDEYHFWILTKSLGVMSLKPIECESRFQLSSYRRKNSHFSSRDIQVKQNKAGIFISQDKYVAKILKKFDLVNVKTAITPMETKVALTKDEEAVDVDVTPKTSHLNAVKRIFKYLKGKPHLGLWYPRESPFDLGSNSLT